MAQLRYCLVLMITGFLSACSGTSPDIENPITPGTSTTIINSFTAVGSSVTVNDIVPINAGIENGEFAVSWEVSSSDPYHVNLYLSTDNTLGSDVKIFEQNCGSLALIYNCNSVADFDCRFTGSNNMSCGTVSVANTEKDLTSFLDSLPKAAFLIIEACNALLDNCKASAIAIELQ